MTLLDATALVALFLDEPAAARVEDILREGEARIGAVNLAEVIDVLVRVFGNDLDRIEDRLVPLLVDDLPVVPVDEGIGRRAAELRVAYYHGQQRPLSMADCLLLATAAVLDDSIATADGPVAQVARAEDIPLIPLPDSSGRKP